MLTRMKSENNKFIINIFLSSHNKSEYFKFFISSNPSYLHICIVFQVWWLSFHKIFFDEAKGPDKNKSYNQSHFILKVEESLYEIIL